MSWGTCYAGSNNIHFDFPPIMDDGRNYASYQPAALLNNNLRKEKDITSNWSYRQYLTQNATTLMQYNQLQACDQCCTCPPRYGNNQPISNTPYLYKSCVQNTQPYGYESSNLKNIYLTDYELQCRMQAPVLSQDDYIKYHYANPN